MKAHDVRHLRLCTTCGSIGDRREMLELPEGLVSAKGEPVKSGLHHGLCVTQTLTHEAILALPPEQRSKLRLSETGWELMRKLLDACEPPDLDKCDVGSPAH